MNIGILREGKIPPDSRVPLTPQQCVQLQQAFPVKVHVQPSPHRCFADDAYRDLGISVVEELADCDVILGVKEIPVSQLPTRKTCLFFSHTIKQQPYNRQLLRGILHQQIRLIDYEVLTDEQGQRVVAFGKFAGMVGAHNALWTWGQRTGEFSLPRMVDLPDYAAACEVYHQSPEIRQGPRSIVLTGGGRVADGARQTLLDMGIRQVSIAEFLDQRHACSVFTQADCLEYVRRKDGSEFQLEHFFRQPQDYTSNFQRFQEVADIMINGIFWDPRAPAFFSVADMAKPTFRIQVIADVTCDIAPASSIPSTLRATSISDPVFGFDARTDRECPAFSVGSVDMMTVDNLPNELPRDASIQFGEQLLTRVIPELFSDSSELLRRATVAVNGQLGPHFKYLSDFVA